MPSFTDKLKPRIKDLDALNSANGHKPNFRFPKDTANWLWLALAGSLIVLALLATQNYSLMRQVSTSEKQLKKMQEENSTLLAKAMEERDALQEELENTKKQFGALQAKAKSAEERAAQAEEEKTYLEEVLINKSKEIEAVRNQTTPQDLTQRIKEKDNEISKLADNTAVLEQKLDKLYKAVDEELANLAKTHNLGDEALQAKKRIQDKSTTIDLGSITIASAAEAPAPIAVPVPTAPIAPVASAPSVPLRSAPKKAGRVLAINQAYNFIVVDLGKIDGIEKDTVLALKKNGKDAGTLSIMELRDVMSACNIIDLKNNVNPEINDEVVIVKRR